VNSADALKDYMVIAVTVVIGLVLTLIPVPPWAVMLRPEWMLAILIFWVMTSPHRVGIALAWIIGLFMDLTTGTLLGQQAFIFCFTAFFVLKFQHWLAQIPLIQQTAMIALLILFDLILNSCLLMLLQHVPVNKLFWLPAITTAVIWPWLSGLLYIYQMKMHVADLG
jgi:rod shape-determining protein MreD